MELATAILSNLLKRLRKYRNGDFPVIDSNGAVVCSVSDFLFAVGTKEIIIDRIQFGWKYNLRFHTEKDEIIYRLFPGEDNYYYRFDFTYYAAKEKYCEQIRNRKPDIFWFKELKKRGTFSVNEWIEDYRINFTKQLKVLQG